MLLPEYQINDIEKGLVLSSISPVKFSNLPGFNQLFLPVEMGDFLQKTSLGNLRNRTRLPFVLLPNNYKNWMCSCILFSWENEILLNRLFIPRRRLSLSPKRNARANAY